MGDKRRTWNTWDKRERWQQWRFYRKIMTRDKRLAMSLYEKWQTAEGRLYCRLEMYIVQTYALWGIIDYDVRLSWGIYCLLVWFLTGSKGLKRDIFYLGWPIAPSYMSPNAGGGGSCGAQPTLSTYSCTHGAQVSFGDLTLYLTYAESALQYC